MNLADILKLAGLDQQEPMSSLSSPGSSCNQHMNPEDMRTLVVKIEQPQPEQEMVATEEVEGSYANAPDEQEVGDTHDDFSFSGFGKRKRHTHDALGNYGDNPLDESQLIAEYENFKVNEAGITILPPDPNDPMANIWAGGKDAIKKAHKDKKIGYGKGKVDPSLAKHAKKRYTDVGVYHDDR